MGDINTNIRIDELESVVSGLAGVLDALPSFYKMKDHAHSDDITEDEFNEIKAAIDAGKIILTGKLTRQNYQLAENAPVVWTYAGDEELILQTFARAGQPGSATLKMQTPMIIDIKYLTDTIIRLTIQDANYYP